MLDDGLTRHAETRTSLAARAAWLSYIGGYRQEEIAERLHLSRVKVNRLIAEAHRDGLVRVFVDARAADCVALEDALTRRFSLEFAVVAPNPDRTELPLLSLGTAGAQYLQNVLDEGRHRIIGVGQGRTLSAVVECLPRLRRGGVTFVSLLGSVTRHIEANPIDLIHRLASRTDGEGHFLPLPFFLDSVAIRDRLLQESSLRPALDLAARADLCLVGIGGVAGDDAYLRATGMIGPDEAADLAARGAVGELLGQFLDREGRQVEVELSRRSPGPSLEQLRGRLVVAVAGGATKVDSIGAVLRSGILRGLITDEVTARDVLGSARPAPRRSKR